jgi:hypothetical protein
VRSFLASSAIFLFVSAAYANSPIVHPESMYPMSGCLDCFNFVAPSVLGAETVSPAEIGLIVYDTYYGMFRGYTHAGRWAKLSNEKSVRAVSGSNDVLSTDDVIVANAATGALTLTLPSAVTVPGKELLLKKSDSGSNTVAIATTGAQTIDGLAASNWVLRRQNDSLSIMSDGANWLVLSNKISSQSTLQERIERAVITPSSSSVCTINSQSGTWLSGTTPVGAGDCTVTIASGVFSAAPTCVATINSGDSTSYLESARINVVSATSFSLKENYVSSGSSTVLAANIAINVICMGPR